jgi:16S rRNA C967 or C1407 C5-methylase (RsmB/RsmF family)
MPKKRKATGKEAFETCYQQHFPSAQEFSWFLESLAQPALPALRFALSNAKQLQHRWSSQGLTWKPLNWCPWAVEWPPEAPPGLPLPGYAERLIYPMNAASLIPVLALDPQPGETILDACAAPGGKALFIHDLLDRQGHLLANDLSPTRRAAMQRTFSEYGAGTIEIGREKAETLFRRLPEKFNRILLDSPCSSEKHVYRNSHLLAKWSESRVRQLQERQYGLLNGLFLALKPGGRLVYSTCAVNKAENEGVVARFLRKKGGQVILEEWPLENVPGEPGLPGEYVVEFDLNAVRRILPHRDGLDPMFVAVFHRLSTG